MKWDEMDVPGGRFEHVGDRQRRDVLLRRACVDEVGGTGGRRKKEFDQHSS